MTDKPQIPPGSKLRWDIERAFESAQKDGDDDWNEAVRVAKVHVFNVLHAQSSPGPSDEVRELLRDALVAFDEDNAYFSSTSWGDEARAILSRVASAQGEADE